MIRGAGRLNKRVDERANWPTPCEPGLIHDLTVPCGLYPLPSVPDRVLPGRVTDGRHLLANDGGSHAGSCES